MAESRAQPQRPGTVIRAIDAGITALFPGWGARRARARVEAMAYGQAYDAARRHRMREMAKDYGGPNAIVGASAEQVRTQAYELDRNHDIVSGGISSLSQNVIGASGIGVEPQPRDADGTLNESLAEQITNLRAEWTRRPEVTHMHDWAQCSRLALRGFAVAGEVYLQHVWGNQAGLRHGSRLPYSVQLMESDQLPFFDDAGRNIVQGVELEPRWKRPVAYHFHDAHPGDVLALQWPYATRRIDASRISCMRNITRPGQVRGISLLASVITRLQDLRDYEESERIAAKIAACMAAFIIKGDAGLYGSGGSPDQNGERQIQLSPGRVYDQLQKGETIQTVDPNRPNVNLQHYRDGQLRAVASGMRVSFSTLSRNYGGSYSSQRQELVEQYGAYGVIAADWMAGMEIPVHRQMVHTAYLSRILDIPPNFPIANLYDCLCIAPQMPWIDPLKEAEGMEALLANHLMSWQEGVRRRGASPRDVLDQQSAAFERFAAWNLPLPAAFRESNAQAQAAPVDEAVQ